MTSDRKCHEIRFDDIFMLLVCLFGAVVGRSLSTTTLDDDTMDMMDMWCSVGLPTAWLLAEPWQCAIWKLRRSGFSAATHCH